MVEAKKLIELNNKKRDLLTEENEKYYSDLLVYIRIQPKLSEQQTEEILMELLDHLLEGQNEGKTAEEIFGDNPKEYADELISQLPNEKLREVVPFISQIVLNILGWFLIMRGIIYGIVKQFRDISENIYPVSTLILVCTIFLNIIFVIWIIFKVIKGSLFQHDQNKGKWKDSIKVGLAGAFGMALVLLVGKFLPELGPSLPFPWYASLIIGAILWLISRFMQRKD